MTQTQEKQIVSQTEYNKKVEMAAMFLERNSYLKKDKAWEEARREVAEKYQVQ